MPPDNNELDDELLALAGEGDSEPSSPAPVKTSASPQPIKLSPAPVDSNVRNVPQKGVARKMNKRTAASRPKLTLQSDEEEAPSAPASPDSLGSGAMDESEEEDDALAPAADVSGDVDDGPRYPLEGKFKSQKDKLEILALPEARREQILSERVEEVERDNFNRQLRQRHEAQQKEPLKAADKKKRSASTADLDESARKPTKKTAASERLEAYKKQREQKHEQRRQGDNRRAQGRSSSSRGPSSESDRSADGQVAWDDRNTKPSPSPSSSPKVDLKWVETIRLSRGGLTSICYTPGFEQVAKNCFVKIAIGPDPQTRVPRYIVCRVREIKTGKPYPIQTPSDNTLQTDQYIVAVTGKTEKVVPFTHCSDSAITPVEWETYKEAVARDGVELLSQTAAEKKLMELRGLKNYRWTDAEIGEKIRRSGGHRARIDQLVHMDAKIRRDKAEQRGDLGAVAEAEATMAKIAARPVRHEPKNSKPIATAQNERLAKLNREIRKSNMESVGRAQVSDKQRERKLAAAIARGDAKASPLARAKAQAKLLQQDDKLKVPADKTIDDLFEGSDRSRASTPAPSSAKKSPMSKPVRQKKLMDDEIIGSLDIDIDIEI